MSTKLQFGPPYSGPCLDSGSGWPYKDLDASLQTYQVGAHFEALDGGGLMASLNSRYTQVGFNIISVQVWKCFMNLKWINFTLIRENLSRTCEGCFALPMTLHFENWNSRSKLRTTMQQYYRWLSTIDSCRSKHHNFTQLFQQIVNIYATGQHFGKYLNSFNPWIENMVVWSI